MKRYILSIKYFMRDIPLNDYIVYRGRVRAYRNLNKRKLGVVWSIQSVRPRKIIEHTRCVLLENVVFSVSEAGRLRVLAERKKNVHACIVGDALEESSARQLSGWVPAYYNPYIAGHFLVDGEPIHKCRYAKLDSDGLSIII